MTPIRILVPVVTLVAVTAACSACATTTPAPPTMPPPQATTSTAAVALPAPTPSAMEPDVPLATLPSPLLNVAFTPQVTAYPPEWPQEIHYPAPFDLIDAKSGNPPGETKVAWIAKLQVQGSPQDAAARLTSFFNGNGWQMRESSQHDAGAVVIIFEKNGSSGIAVLDHAADPTRCNILITVFL